MSNTKYYRITIRHLSDHREAIYSVLKKVVDSTKMMSFIPPVGHEYYLTGYDNRTRLFVKTHMCIVGTKYLLIEALKADTVCLAAGAAPSAISEALVTIAGEEFSYAPESEDDTTDNNRNAA